MTDRELMTMAREASMNAYVPYSRFPVGAAIECDDGSVSPDATWKMRHWAAQSVPNGPRAAKR